MVSVRMLLPRLAVSMEFRKLTSDYSVRNASMG
jgi:hypothetical protein